MDKTYSDIRSLVSALGATEDEIMSALADSIEDNINLLESEVKSKAPKAGDITPKYGGGAKVVDYNIGSYTYKILGPKNLSAEFGISGEASDLAAFIEFGTGTDAAGYVPTLSTGFQMQAMEFYKNGKGTLLHAPFLLPTWYRIKDKILADAQENIKKAISK